MRLHDGAADHEPYPENIGLDRSEGLERLGSHGIAEAKQARLMGALDEIDGRFGRGAAVTAPKDFRREWKLRSEMRSPAWTTSIADVPTVAARR